MKDGFNQHGKKSMSFSTAEIIAYRAATNSGDNKIEALLICIRDLKERITELEKKLEKTSK